MMWLRIIKKFIISSTIYLNLFWDLIKVFLTKSISSSIKEFKLKQKKRLKLELQVRSLDDIFPLEDAKIIYTYIYYGMT